MLYQPLEQRRNRRPWLKIQARNSQTSPGASNSLPVRLATPPAARLVPGTRQPLPWTTLLEGQAKALTQKCIDMAIAGDTVALRLAMERVLPVRRGRPVQFDLPPLNSPADLVAALGGILQAVAAGDITPDEGATIAGMMDAKRRAHETQDLELRLAAIERATGGKP